MTTGRLDEDEVVGVTELPDLQVDTTVAQNARVWNYWLGGKDNYEADRRLGNRVAARVPRIVEVARADRRFLVQMVSHLVEEAGVRQFLDVGAGLPTADSTHQVAQCIEPSARVVYVDNDPTALTHARELLVESPFGNTDYIDADVQDPQTILARAEETLDLSEAVAVLMLGVLNFVEETEQARVIVEQFMKAVPSGSYLALAHPTAELGGEANVEAMRLWNENSPQPVWPRTEEEITRLLDGLDVLEPGLISCSQWRAEPDDAGELPVQVPAYAVLARKP